MTFTLLAVAGWMIAALAFTAGWATHARLSFRPRALAAASSQPPLRAAPAGPTPPSKPAATSSASAPRSVYIATRPHRQRKNSANRNSP